MTIIEIKALENGAHRNQTGDFNTVPDGYAVIPEDVEIPDTFPFVDITVENNIVTSITAGVVPDPGTIPEPEPTSDEILNALLGVSK